MRRLTLVVFSIIVFSFIFALFGAKIQAQSQTPAGADCDAVCLQKLVDDYSSKVDQLKEEKNTLANQLAIFDSRISLMTIRIEQNQRSINDKEKELAGLKEEIDSLTGRIVRLGDSLVFQTKVLGLRVRSAYKNSIISPVEVIFGGGDLTEKITRYKYLRVLENEDQRLLTQMKITRANYADQKVFLEEKKGQVESLKKQIEAAKKSAEADRASLNGQRSEKANLLKITQNDEKRYQQLLAQAEAQLKAFQRFISGQGGASLLANQTVCNDWGCYYNQRDSSWGLVPIGTSSEDLAEYGCLITSSAMVLSHYGHRVTPAQVAQTLEAFVPTTAYMVYAAWQVDGVTFTRVRVGASTGVIDSEVAAGRPVIVGIGQGPSHFVVIKDKVGNDYLMNDPYVENGRDILFSSKYSLNSITEVDTVRVN